MFCRKCGTENADGSPTCVSCGAQLTPVNPYAAGGQPTGPPGTKPDNYLVPGDLSDLERSHLRDAFVVVRTMQSAVAQGRGTVM